MSRVNTNFPFHVKHYDNCLRIPHFTSARARVFGLDLTSQTKFFLLFLLETQEFQSVIDDWCLRRTKALIADQLPQKGMKLLYEKRGDQLKYTPPAPPISCIWRRALR